jgi:hypothetical protein
MMRFATSSAISTLRRAPTGKGEEHPEDAFDRWKLHRWDHEFF